jgi:hypothetical protein
MGEGDRPGSRRTRREASGNALTVSLPMLTGVHTGSAIDVKPEQASRRWARDSAQFRRCSGVQWPVERRRSSPHPMAR